MSSIRRACMTVVCALTLAPTLAFGQRAPRPPRALSLSVDARCSTALARALRGDLVRPERARVLLVTYASADTRQVSVRCEGDAVTLVVRRPDGASVAETLRGVDPHDLREPLLALVERAEAEPSLPARVEARRDAPRPPAPLVATASEDPSARRWSLFLGPSLRVASAASTALWGLSATSVVDVAPRLSLSIGATVERGFGVAPQIDGVEMTLFGLALGAQVAPVASPRARWTVGVGARIGAAAQQETGARARSHVAPWVGTALDTAATLTVARHVSIRASAELGLAASAALALVDETPVVGAGPFWFCASLALGWRP